MKDDDVIDALRLGEEFFRSCHEIGPNMDGLNVADATMHAADVIAAALDRLTAVIASKQKPARKARPKAAGYRTGARP